MTRGATKMKLLLLLVFAAAAAAALYEEDGHVFSKFESAAAFDDAVLRDDSALWMVSLYASSGCDACEAIAGDLSAAAVEVGASLGVKAAALDVSSGVGQKIGKRLNVARVPAVVAISGASTLNPYTNKPTRDVAVWTELLESGFSAAGLKRWITRQLPGDVVVRATSEADILGSKIPKAVLCTERSTTSPLAKSLGGALRGRLVLFEVPAASDLAARFVAEGEALPILVALEKDGAGVEEKFSGSLKNRSEVLAWLESHALKEKAANPPPKEDKKSAWGAVSPAIATTSAELNALAFREEAAVVLCAKDVDPGADVAAKIASLDGSGTLKAVVCDGPPECEGLDADKWRAYKFGDSSELLGEFADAKGAYEAAAASVPADDVTLVGGGNLDTFMQQALSLPDVPPMGIIVFSTKDEVSVGVKAVGRLLSKTTGVRVAQYVVVQGPADRSVMERFQITKPPAIMAFHATPAEGKAPAGAVSIGLAHYDRAAFGPPTFASITAFVEMLFTQLDPDAATALRDGYLASGTTRRRKTAAATSSKGVVDLASEPGAFDAVCARDLCAIFLLDQYGRPSFETELEAAKEAALAEASSPYAFGWLDGACHLETALAFDVDPSKLPTLVAYAPKKQRYAPYVGNFAPRDLRSFLRGVLSGKIGTAPLRAPLAAPDVDVDCASLASGTDEPLPEDDEDADDLMAEILAEEAAEKRRLQEEAEAEAEAERQRLREEQEAAAAKNAPKKKKKKKKTTTTKKKKQPDL